jgi:hypothetical protein
VDLDERRLARVDSDLVEDRHHPLSEGVECSCDSQISLTWRFPFALKQTW